MKEEESMNYLEVCISTYGKRINNLCSLPKSENVKYCIIHQSYQEVTYSNDLQLRLKYGDVRVINSNSVGLTNSRNEAITNSRSRFILISDDDVCFLDGFQDTVLSAFENSQSDILIFKIKTDKGNDFREYKTKEFKYNKLDCLKVCSIEMAFRKDDSTFDFFNPRFGLNSDYICGEESILLFDSLDRGKEIAFIPEYIVIHPEESTSTGRITEEQLEAKGAVYRHGFGKFISLLFLIRLSFFSRFCEVNRLNKFKTMISLLKGYLRY